MQRTIFSFLTRARFCASSSPGAVQHARTAGAYQNWIALGGLRRMGTGGVAPGPKIHQRDRCQGSRRRFASKERCFKAHFTWDSGTGGLSLALKGRLGKRSTTAASCSGQRRILDLHLAGKRMAIATWVLRNAFYGRIEISGAFANGHPCADKGPPKNGLAPWHTDLRSRQIWPFLACYSTTRSHMCHVGVVSINRPVRRRGHGAESLALPRLVREILNNQIVY